MASVYAIIPVFLIILCGFLCRHYQFPGDNFWPGAEKLSYFVLFPALLVYKMATAELGGIDFLNPFIIIILLFSSMTVLLLLLKPFLRLDTAKFTSVYQGSIRFNTYIGLAIAQSLYGTEGLVVAVIVASIMIPLVNVSCVLLMSHYQGKSSGYWGITKSIITNPLILACIIGMGINVSQLPVPGVIFETLSVFSRAALPLGLLTVGAALALNSIRTALKPLLIASLAKFVILPAIAMGLCLVFPVEPMVRNAILVFTVLPTASASYVLAKQLGGDFQLMATLITGQTLLAFALIPLMMAVLA